MNRQPSSLWKKAGQTFLTTALISASLFSSSSELFASPSKADSSKTATSTSVQTKVTVDYFYESMKKTAEIAGIPFTMAKPEGTMLQRQTAAKAIQEWLSLPVSSNSFKDVPEKHAYTSAISAVYQAGIMNGYSKELFFPKSPLTQSDIDLISERILAYIQPFEIEEATIRSIQKAMEQGKLTSHELVQMYLDRIEKNDDKGSAINSIITINDSALEIADQLDAERKTSGPRGPLHGIPILVKDNYDTSDMPTSAGCICLKDSIPSEDADQIAKLKAAGAIILGKTNLHEFAFGITTSSSLGGQTLNPYALDHYPGGSSGGTGAAIAANFAVAGMGTDTGGSIRIPSSFNSLVGIRPTIGLSSRDGIIPLALTQDVGGPMARTVADAALVLEATTGYDPDDLATSYSVGRTPESYTSYLDEKGLQGARIGVATELFASSNAEEKEVSALVYQAVSDIRSLGASAVEIKIPNLDQIGKFPSLSSYEFKFQLNDYLGELGDAAPYHTLSEIIESGEFDQSQASSMKSRNARELLETEEYKDIVLNRTKVTREALLKVMAENDLDAIVYPTTTQAAAVIGDSQNAGGNNRLSPFSGFPAITVPAGFTTEGLPVGIEFLGRAFDEGTLIKLAYSYEQGTQHRKAPVLSE
ncbi:amidase family protein [Paenibacillus sp. Marseille-Q4541]|uniref:amidase family protein n=1 Tax=Paenibacillus sp. Marseille-Q4541 TaxID=2831522 RepID=UPI001BAB7269|nr:amidase family protein [Paenibacillus sp. Marseille-Q4541]